MTERGSPFCLFKAYISGKSSLDMQKAGLLAASEVVTASSQESKLLA